MKTKAAVLYEMGAARPYADSTPLAIEELDLDGPGEDEVLVEVAAAGLCHSDLSVIDGARPRPTPMAIGHEAAGVVADVGKGVDDLEPGDHVVMIFVPACGHCIPCAEGRPALCEPGAAANPGGLVVIAPSEQRVHGHRSEAMVVHKPCKALVATDHTRRLVEPVSQVVPADTAPQVALGKGH